jgi:hypothetical protein
MSNVGAHPNATTPGTYNPNGGGLYEQLNANRHPASAADIAKITGSQYYQTGVGSPGDATAYRDALAAAHGKPSMEQAQAMREAARTARQTANQGRTVDDQGNPIHPGAGAFANAPNGFAGVRYDPAANQVKWQAAYDALPDGPQKADMLWGHVSNDSNAMLRLEDSAFPGLIQTSQARIAQLQQSLSNPAFASQPGYTQMVQQQIADEQAKLTKIQSVQQLRTQIGPYLSYLPKAPNGTDIDWNYMAAHPDWANTLPDNVKQALFDMHIGQFAKTIAGGQ